MKVRATAALVAGAIVLAGATTAHGQDQLAGDRAPPTARGDLAIGSTLAQTGPPASPSSPQPTDPTSASPSPANGDAASPLGSGAGIIVLVAIGGAFLWLRTRAMRR